MKVKKNYSTKDMEEFEKNILRISYMFRRFSGTRTCDGKLYSQYEVIEIKDEIVKLFANPQNFDWDTGKVLSDEEYKEHYGYGREE